MSRKKETVYVIALLSFMAFLMISSISNKSYTYDEKSFLNFGRNCLNRDFSRKGFYADSKLPFNAFNAMTYIGGEKILDRWGSGLDAKERDRFLRLSGRMATVVFSLILGLFVYRWSKELYGVNAGLFSLLIYVFSPNILAHSRLITADLYATLMVTLSMFTFWKFLKWGGSKRAIVSACVLGLSQLAKYTCVYLYPIFLMLAVLKYSPLFWKLVKDKQIKEIRACLGVFLKYVLLFLLISIVVINAGFLLDRSYTPLKDYYFISHLFKKVQLIPFVRDIPIPFPYPYVQGLDMVKFNEDTSMTFGNIYLLGQLKMREEPHWGFKGYYFYCYLLKEPIAIQIFVILSIILFFFRRKKRNFFDNELFLLFPSLFFILYLNFLFKAQIGIRFLIVIFPLLYIFCGSLFERWLKGSAKLRSLLIGLMMYLAVSVLSYFPHFIPYFNEIVWDRKQAYRFLADSNIDWGQDRDFIKGYKKRYPEVAVHPMHPITGRVIVSVNHLVGVFSPRSFRWLRENLEPVGHIHYSYLVYDVTREDLKRIYPEK